jgi:carboxymethylenebutenolidase
MIDFKSNGGTTPGYLALPEGDGKHPGIVVIQEWWGLVPHIKDVTERFAREGFVALAPDLYHGIAASEPDEAKKLAMALDRNRAVSEILAAAKYLKSLDSVSPKKVGAIGWCMGGGLALSSAAEANELATAIAFYGRPLAKEDVAKLHVPVMGLYGELDQGIPVTAVREFENELKQAGVAHEIHIYPNAPHAFFNDARPHIYKADAAQDAWQKTLGWFRKYLV